MKRDRATRWIHAAAMTAAALAPLSAPAQGAVTLYGGWRGSSTLQDEVAARSVRLRDAASASLAVDIDVDPARQLQFFVSRQSTSLRVMPLGAATTQKLPVKVTYAHIGGTNFFAGPIGAGPYVAGGLGLTVISPGIDGFDSETRPSLNLAFGYAMTAAAGLSLRIEGRGYVTLVNSSGSLFCAGGCTIAVTGDTLQQLELMIGIGWRF